MARIIVDDLSSQFSYGGGTWSSVSDSHFYGGEATWPDFARGSTGDTGVYGSLTFNFQGTSVAFFGNTPPAKDSQWSMFSIDGSPPYNSSFMDPAPPSSRQWYQSPTLPEGQHNITITHIASTSVDYAVVNAGQTTPLLGQVLIIDDNDPSITYGGSWTRNTSMFSTSYDPFIGLPFGNATHQTTSTGASATFSFIGVGVTVGGIFSFNMLGTLSVNYTLDGVSSIQNYAVTTKTTQYIQGVKQTENFVLFQSPTLVAGNHTLQIQVTDCVNQIFELDYILYNPSFASLASKPSAPSPSTTSTSTTVAAPHASTKGSTPTAAIVGGVVGGLVLLLLISLLILYRKRFFKRPTPSPSMRTSSIPGLRSLDPFVLSPSATSGTTGFQILEPKTNMASLKTATPDQRLSSSTSNRFSPATSGVFSPQSSASGAREDERLLNRMQRLQKLFGDLQRENAAAGIEDGNNPRVAELRGRIAELVREEGENNTILHNNIIPIGEMENVLPPAYEPT